MNRNELLEALLVERFAPNSQAMFEAAERRVSDDSELATYARRKALDDACADFDIPRKAAT